ncbi:MAG: signal transduction histidine kinase, glucose-6-phosphate specific [Proteobacteria bacterium]|nr:signal transduction histidine kinase, glucose-6-phosphate specific [Pseudomonadota bacterium]
MDLRKRLVGHLGALLGGLMLVALLVNLYSLRQDIDTEVGASERLVDVLLAAGQLAPGLPPTVAAQHLHAIVEGRNLRHLNISPDASTAPAGPTLSTRLANWLGVESTAQAGQLIRLGEHSLRIAPNPASEIEERLGDTVRLCITLLFFSGATLLVAWRAADRALAPVRELEAGLQRLARGDSQATLPPFALREFRRVAAAIDQLATALSDSQAARRQLSQQLIEIQEDERRTLARELHDEMGQTLTAIGVTAAYLERHAGQLAAGQIVECAGDLRRDVKTSGEQLRAMLRQLRPHGLDATALASALRELVGSWQQRTAEIEFSLALPGGLPVMGETAGLVLYRVVQEALTNVVRHSGARHCRVSIEVAAQTLQLSVQDDGQGLPATGPARRGGLLGMEERLAMAGGSLTVDSGPNGLHLQVSLPLKREEQPEEHA